MTIHHAAFVYLIVLVLWLGFYGRCSSGSGRLVHRRNTVCIEFFMMSFVMNLYGKIHNILYGEIQDKKRLERVTDL